MGGGGWAQLSCFVLFNVCLCYVPTVNSDKRDFLVRHCQRLFPALPLPMRSVVGPLSGPLKEEGMEWAGLRPMSPDGLPMIGASSIRVFSVLFRSFVFLFSLNLLSPCY